MTNGMDIDGESQITLTRTIDAHIDDVFAAWTDPALIEQWQADEAELDAFEGGEYKFTTFGDEEDPEDHTVSGEILEKTPAGQGSVSELVHRFCPFDRARQSVQIVEQIRI